MRMNFSTDTNDTQSDTLGHISEILHSIPNMAKIRFGSKFHAKKHWLVLNRIATEQLTGYATKLEEVSRGKDTMTGHWEIMGLKYSSTIQCFPRRLPEDLLEKN